MFFLKDENNTKPFVVSNEHFAFCTLIFASENMRRKAWCKSGTRTPGPRTSGPWDPRPGTPFKI